METNNTQTLKGVFSADKIQKYWKNQQPHTGDSDFTDSLFPPEQNSLLSKDKDGNFIDKFDGAKRAQDLNAEEIEWKRASEIFSKYLLFDEKIECSDIKQGNLGNCYFLSAIAALTEFPQLIYQIFRTKEVNSQGYYEVVLFVDGEWVVVPVDDYFPVKKGTKNFSFARPNGNELWVVLLEKAWAKINGGYVNIISGWPSDALAALTGFSNQKLSTKDFQKEELWEILKTSDQSDNIMCTSTKNDPSIEELGLVVNHAYTLIGAKETIYNNQPLRLLHIRNPWGQREWLGAWSDNDSKWTEELNTFCKHTVEDDGTFFMSLEDFVQIFDSTHICHVMYNSNIKTFKVSEEEITTPHVFNMYLPEKTKVSVSVITKHWRFNRELKNVTHPFSVVIARLDTKSKSLVEVDGEFCAYENLDLVKVLPKGLYAIWVFCAQSQSKDQIKPEEYLVRFASSTNYKVKLETFDNGFEFVRELILAGVREKFSKEITQSAEQFYGIENQFKRTGLGYRCVINKSGIVYQKWVINSTKLEHMFMLPPHKDNSEFVVPPKSAGICLAMKEKPFGSFWFNLQSNYESFSCKEGTDPTNTKKVNMEQYINIEVTFEDVNNENYYDYISSSLSSAKKDLEFSHVDTDAVALEELKKEHPELMKLILSLPSVDDDSDLTWGKLMYENGVYIGQISPDSKRQGRGVYQWTNDKVTYAGYWNNNTRDNFGKFLNRNLKVTYEGGYSNGVKSGKGKLFFINGDIYEGLFCEDKRQGLGVYIWCDGSFWQGNFENNQMHGVGRFDPNDGTEPWVVEYVNGQCS